MADWLYIGYCTVLAMFAVAAAYAVAFGLRALRRLSRSLLLGFAAAAIVATLTAQKTNNVPPNMNQPQMMQGGGSFQTGFTGLTGLVGIGSIMNLVNPVQTTIDDIMRGWRVESVTTNAAVSYAMPTNATLVGNWHIHGASSSFGNNRIDFGNWAFPLGTNDEAFSSFWYFIDGRIRPAPRDAAHEICAVGVPMSAVPGQSRLWRLDGDDGSRVLTWENFFLGGDTNSPVNAQIVLSPNGDFLTRSNDVETVCRRINPDDWDDDGIPNDEDANPTACDGDFFGPSNILPAGANTNAYCTISVVATGPDALVTFTGDKPSNYPDPRFVAKSGVTNEVVILIGKTYAISSDWPFAVVDVSDPETEVWQIRGAVHQTYACRPVTISASEGNPFTMDVSPLNLGGAFVWVTNNCCSVIFSNGMFVVQCGLNCQCDGCSPSCSYEYEGYGISANGGNCGCTANAGVLPAISLEITPRAVLFEPQHTDANGALVLRRSTYSRIECSCSGCDSGTVVISDLAGAAEHLILHLGNEAGPIVGLPYECHVEGDETIVLVAEGISHGALTNDIQLAAIYESGGHVIRVERPMSVFEVFSETRDKRFNEHRKTLGVGEDVCIRWRPGLWNCILIDGEVDDYSAHVFEAPHSSSQFSHSVSFEGASLPFDFTVVEPLELEEVYVDRQNNGSPNVAGSFAAYIGIAVMPTNVSFDAVRVQEIGSMATNVYGYFSNMTNVFDHGQHGANIWHGLMANRYQDKVSISEVPEPWGQGGGFTWPITNAWRVAHDNAVTNHFSHRLKYDQTFELDSNGTVRIRKMGYTIQRTTNDVLTAIREMP